MPRSKRRKGAKPYAPPAKGTPLLDLTPRRYYDPGKKPRPRNMVKQATPRHDHRRGS